MILTSEIFVMALFILGLPLFYSILENSRLPHHRLFLLSYLLLTLSNIFTVIEEFRFGNVFNFLEHLMIACAAVTICAAVLLLTSKTTRVPDSGTEDGA